MLIACDEIRKEGAHAGPKNKIKPRVEGKKKKEKKGEG